MDFGAYQQAVERTANTVSWADRLLNWPKHRNGDTKVKRDRAKDKRRRQVARMSRRRNRRR